MNRFSKQFRSSFQRIRDPLLIVDSDGVIHAANPAARDVLDFDEGGNLRDARWIDRRVDFDGASILRLADGPSEVCGHHLTDPDGNEADMVLDVIDLTDGRGGAGLKLIQVKDYSGYNRYERWKDELVSMAAHEIKNPLAAMRTSMKTLVSQTASAMPEGERNLLAVSIRSIDRLTRLLDNLLDVSRINSGNYTSEPRWVDAGDFAAEVMGAFTALFNVRRQRLKYSVSDDLFRIYVDAPKLEQILINFLNNAMKFTPEGGEVELGVERAGIEVLPDDLRILPWGELGGLAFVRFTVRDTGIGMTGETLSHLFTRYHRDKSLGGGVGSHLGLSISKKLAEVQNGSLEVESELGVGTRVSVSVPSDEQTFTLLSRVRSIDRVLSRLVGLRRGIVLHVVRKDESSSWPEVFDGWPSKPAVNPVVDDEKTGMCYAWALGDRLALVVLAETDETGEVRSYLGSADESVRRGSGPRMDHMITTHQLSARDLRASALMALALRPRSERVGPITAARRTASEGDDVLVDSVQCHDQESENGRRQNFTR